MARMARERVRRKGEGHERQGEYNKKTNEREGEQRRLYTLLHIYIP